MILSTQMYATSKCPALPLRAQVATMTPLKKLIPVHLFANRLSLASTAACPQPTTPDNWVRHAMDTARLAATAGDLTNPSIRDAGNIFTQMLQQLQASSIIQQCPTTLTFFRKWKRIESSSIKSQQRSWVLLNALFAMRGHTMRRLKHSSRCATISWSEFTALWAFGHADRARLAPSHLRNPEWRKYFETLHPPSSTLKRPSHMKGFYATISSNSGSCAVTFAYEYLNEYINGLMKCFHRNWRVRRHRRLVYYRTRGTSPLLGAH